MLGTDIPKCGPDHSIEDFMLNLNLFSECLLFTRLIGTLSIEHIYNPILHVCGVLDKDRKFRLELL